MIKSDHKLWARYLFNFYIDRELKNNFDHFYLLNKPPLIEEGKGLIVTPNHFSWWDGFLIDFIHRKYFSSRKFYILMLEDQLKRYWFFRKLGAYSINLFNPKSMVQTIQYTREIVSDEESFVTIYPQGEILPFDIEPFTIKKGLLKFTAGLKKASFVLPIAFKIQFNDQKKPDIYLRFGERINVQDILKDYDTFSRAFINNIQLCSKEAADKKQILNLFN